MNFSDGIFVLDPVILPVILGVGIIVVCVNSYQGFLYGIFISLLFGTKTLTSTKILDFLNLLDIGIIIIVLALLKDFLFKKHKKITIPKVLTASLIIIFIGFCQSMYRYEDFYITIRAIRWVITMPFFFLASTYMVKTKNHVKLLLLTLLVCEILLSLQGYLYLRYMLSVSDVLNPERFRTFYFVRMQALWLLAGFFFKQNGKIPLLILQVLTGILFIVYLVSQQFKSIGIAFIITIFMYKIVFLKELKLKRFLTLRIPLKLVALFAVLLMTTSYFVSSTNLSIFASSYAKRLSDVSIDVNSKDSQNISRLRASEVEIEDWKNGNIFFGEGIFYYQRHGYGFSDSNVGTVGGVAYGHLGYVAYLSQLGVFGFLILGFWFPFSVVGYSKKVFRYYRNDPIMRYLSILSAMTFIFLPILFLFSGSFLNGYYVVPGILAGAMYRFKKTTYSEIHFN